jgi:hypothetical protein
MRVGISIVTFALFACFNAHAVNKCKDASGKVSYQDAPCATSSQAQTLKVPGQGAGLDEFPEGQSGYPSAESEPKTEAERRALRKKQSKQAISVASTQGTYEGCSRVHQGFSQRHGALYAKWRRKNAFLIQQHEWSKPYQAELKKERQKVLDMAKERVGNEKVGAALSRGFCEKLFIDLLRVSLTADSEMGFNSRGNDSRASRDVKKGRVIRGGYSDVTLANAQAAYESCSELDPTFEKQHADKFNRWREQNEEAFSFHEQRSEYQSLVEKFKQKSLSPESIAKTEKFCAKEFGPLILRSTRPTR